MDSYNPPGSSTALPTIIDAFEFGDLTVRIYDRDGEPWFPLADVARALGYTTSAGSHKLVEKLREGQWITLPIRKGNRGNPNVTLVNEPGLYLAIMRSEAANAVDFQDWVFDVLKTIRKTGAYVSPNASVAGVAAAAQESGNLQVANNLIKTVADVLNNAVSGPIMAGLVTGILRAGGVDVPQAAGVQQTWTMIEIAEQYGIDHKHAGKLAAPLGLVEGDDFLFGFTQADQTKKVVQQKNYFEHAKAQIEEVLRTYATKRDRDAEAKAMRQAERERKRAEKRFRVVDCHLD